MSENKQEKNKAVTIRVKARIISVSNDSANATTLTLEIVDKIVRDEKIYYGYEVISNAFNLDVNAYNSRTAILSAFCNNSVDALNGQHLYLYSLENTIEIAEPKVSSVWQEMLVSMCKNHVFVFVLEFNGKIYKLKKVEF